MAFWIFQNLVITAAFAAAVAAVCRFSRLGPVARHALWVLVLVKFVTPPLVVWPWAAPDPFGLSAIGQAPKPITLSPDGGNVVPDDALARVLINVGTGTPAPRTPGVTVARDSGLIWFWLLAIWGSGSFIVMGIEGARLARVMRRAKRTQPVDSAIVDRVATLSAELGIRPLPVVGIAGGGSPAVWGFGRPRLLWPADVAADASDACIDGLLLHELAHVKRRDHIVGWIELAGGIVWWWNPVFWHVRAALREQAELACDAWVIAALPNGRRAYAESLLALSGPEVREEAPVAVMGMRAGNRRMLERRLVMIMKGRAPVRLPRVGAVSLALLSMAALPAWATQAPQKPASIKPVVPVVVEPKVEVHPEVQVKTPPHVVLRNGKVMPIQKPVTDVKEIRVEPRFQRIHLGLTQLPQDGQDLVKSFETERDAIQAEADKKIADRRASVEKSMLALQEKYTKEGKLDEAIAIRDFIKAGMPGLNGKLFMFRR